jgi:uncharacterized protein YnzC (UPF0291/DUF896 family)
MGISEEEIKRINELARKKKTEGLTPEEIEEQAALRGKYIASIRANMRSQLEQIRIVEPDGRITKPEKKKRYNN